MKVQSYLGIALLIGLSVILFSCGGHEAEQPPPPPAPEPEEEPQAIIEEEELETIEIVEITHALITFITGDAYIIDDGETDGGFFADIGGTLGPGQSLEVESGYAELQIGDIGTVRVQEASTVRLDDIVLSSQGSSVDIRVVSGSILNKVERLAGADSYEIRTETAVMGVRGTEFGVNVDSDGETRVAVREGRVAMVPPAADPDRVRQRAAGAGNAAAAVEAVAVSLAENAPVIEANQESRLDRNDAAEAEVVAATIDETITEIEEQSRAGETVDVEAVAVRLTAAAEETTTAARSKTEERRTELSDDSRVELEEIEEIRYIPLPPPPAEEPDDDAAVADGDEDEAEPTPAVMPVLVPVRVQVVPEGATIAINGRRVGQNRFSGVYQPGDRVTFELSLDGYRTETLSVTVDPDRGRAYRVQLAPVPQRP
ncbi:MAG: FecR domain-containing protein, partial [Alkalispirochaeta sp.]